MAGRGSGGALDRGDDPRKRALLQYVREVQPNAVESFLATSTPSVVAAMKQTVSNMVGTLPPQHFQVTIDTVADTLATLMNTMLKTGYMMRNAQYRLELQAALRAMAPATPAAAAVGGSSSSSSSGGVLPSRVGGAAAAVTGAEAAAVSELPAAVSGVAAAVSGPAVGPWADTDVTKYAPGVQKSKVEGEVMRWHHDHGLERLPAKEYIEALEAEVAALRAALVSGGGSSSTASFSSTFQPQLGPGSSSGGSSAPSLDLGSGSSGGLRPAGAGAGFTSAGGVSSSAGGTAAPAPASSPASFLSGLATAGAGGLAALPPAMQASPWSASELLDYIRGLEPGALAELGACDGDVADAMAAFVGRLMGTRDRAALRTMSSEFSAVELSKLLFWLLVVGWSLRGLEVRWEMEEGFPPSLDSGGGLAC